MKHSFYSEISNQLLFTAYTSVKFHKTNLFRIHNHAELEIGYICSGDGEYILNGEHFNAQTGDIFLVRANEQHCIPTIHSHALRSFNFHITSHYLWNVCSEYISPKILQLMISDSSIPHKISGMSDTIIKIMGLMDRPHENRFMIRSLTLELIKNIAQELEPYSHNTDCPTFSLSHIDDIQYAIAYIEKHLKDDITLDDIAKIAKLSRSHLSDVFKGITGISPYEYLLLQRINLALSLLRSSSLSITEICYECGFRSQANFNKCFKRITGTSPSLYRKSKL